MRDDIRDAISLLNSHGIPAMRSKDPGYLVFEVGESVFRALLPADREGTAADVRGYLSQWTGDNRSITAMTSIAVCPCPVVRTEQTDG